jgi:cold shock CspA family protein
MPIGTVKRVFQDRAFGFITANNDSGDIFFGFSAVIGRVTLEVGDSVRYEIDYDREKRPRATHVELL